MECQFSRRVESQALERMLGVNSLEKIFTFYNSSGNKSSQFRFVVEIQFEISARGFFFLDFSFLTFFFLFTLYSAFTFIEFSTAAFYEILSNKSFWFWGKIFHIFFLQRIWVLLDNNLLLLKVNLIIFLGWFLHSVFMP